MAGRWVDVVEAARELNISTDAVRKRIARGSLRSDRPDGNVLVWLDDGRTEAGHEPQVGREALLEAKEETIRTLREQLESERRANEENRRLLAALIQRVPELEAPADSPPEARGSPEPAAEGAQPRSSTGSAKEGAEPRSWWQRMFGT